MRKNKQLQGLEAWVSNQAKRHHDTALAAGMHPHREDDDLEKALHHGGMATAFELVLEKLAELRDEPWK